jgi:hypothetical protein
MGTIVATEVAVEVEAMMLERQQLRLLCAAAATPAAASKSNSGAGLERPEDGAHQRHWRGRLRRGEGIKYKLNNTLTHATEGQGLILLATPCTS